MTDARTSPAHFAAARGDAASLRLLLVDDGPNSSATWARDVDGQTVLHLAARAGHLPSIKVVLGRVCGLSAKAGGLEAKDRFSRTALQWAAANGHDAACSELIRCGACSKNVPQDLFQALALDDRSGSDEHVPHQAERKRIRSAEQIRALAVAICVEDNAVEGVDAAVSGDGRLFAVTALRDLCCGAVSTASSPCKRERYPVLLHCSLAIPIRR